MYAKLIHDSEYLENLAAQLALFSDPREARNWIREGIALEREGVIKGPFLGAVEKIILRRRHDIRDKYCV